MVNDDLVIFQRGALRKVRNKTANETNHERWITLFPSL